MRTLRFVVAPPLSILKTRTIRSSGENPYPYPLRGACAALVVALGVLPAFAATATAGVLHVAEDGSGDFLTIQEAVDAARPRDTIMVGPGEYAGAVVDVSVNIEGSGDATVIDAGDPMFGTVGFLICGRRGINCQGRGSRTTIRNLSIEGTVWGVFVDAASDVEISDLTVTNVNVGVRGRFADYLTVTDVHVTGTIHGITNFYGNGCIFTDNEIRDFRGGPWHANGIIAFGDNCLVADNFIYHVGEQVCNASGDPCGLHRDETYTGINVWNEGTPHTIVDNDVTIAVFDPNPVGDGRLWSFPVFVQGPNTSVIDNDLTGIGTDGVCPVSTPEWPWPTRFYESGCIALFPDVQQCSAPSTPPGCITIEDNDLQVF